MEIKYKNTGFTLIELSIVLVIISLIVGGVIGGKALIHQARLKNVITEVNTLKVAVNSFNLQYDALPGDMRDAWDYFGDGISSYAGPCWFNGTGSAGCNGTGDQKILGGDERNKALKHLGLAELIIPHAYGVWYQSSFDDAANFLLHNINDKNYIRFSTGDGANTNIIAPKDAYSLDKKHDDGNAYSGYIEGFNITTESCAYGAGLYSVAEPSNSCMMIFYLDL